MILRTATDCEDAWQLLGLYQQEIMKTGIIDYPLQYEGDIQIPLEKPISEQEQKKISDSQETPTINSVASVNNFDLSCDLPIVPFIVVVVKEQVSKAPNPVPKLREELLDEQAEELRLFYLYVQEVENTGNISKVPDVIRLKN